MKKSNVTFVGSGNMAFAIAKGMIKNSLVASDQIIMSDLSKDRLKYIKDELGAQTTTDNIDAIRKSDVIIISVKPQIFRVVYKEFAAELENKCIISIMAGVSFDELSENLPSTARVLRTMPNMPAMVGEGMTALSTNHSLTSDEYDYAKEIFLSTGEICEVPENLLDAVIGICGSGPAYAFMFIEALADAGVLHGLSRELSYKLACQMVKGSAVAVQQSGLHPAELKDRVCSPAGTTIEAVKSLEKNGFQGVVIEAVDECVKKAKRM